jgi:hypothetical protein
MPWVIGRMNEKGKRQLIATDHGKVKGFKTRKAAEACIAAEKLGDDSFAVNIPSEILEIIHEFARRPGSASRLAS